jgi:hypothetical protein
LRSRPCVLGDVSDEIQRDVAENARILKVKIAEFE